MKPLSRRAPILTGSPAPVGPLLKRREEMNEKGGNKRPIRARAVKNNRRSLKCRRFQTLPNCLRAAWY